LVFLLHAAIVVSKEPAGVSREAWTVQATCYHHLEQPLLVVEGQLWSRTETIDEQADLQKHHDRPGNDQSDCCGLQRGTVESSTLVGILEICSLVGKVIGDSSK
jgi:hypothetical protein